VIRACQHASEAFFFIFIFGRHDCYCCLHARTGEPAFPIRIIKRFARVLLLKVKRQSAAQSCLSRGLDIPFGSDLLAVKLGDGYVSRYGAQLTGFSRAIK